MCYVGLLQQMYHVLRRINSADVSCGTWVYFSRCIMCYVGLQLQLFLINRYNAENHGDKRVFSASFEYLCCGITAIINNLFF